MFTLIQQVTACRTLPESVTELVEGLAGLVQRSEDIPALIADMRANARDLAAALTVNTSHIAVDPRDTIKIAAIRAAVEGIERGGRP